MYQLNFERRIARRFRIWNLLITAQVWLDTIFLFCRWSNKKWRGIERLWPPRNERTGKIQKEPKIMRKTPAVIIRGRDREETHKDRVCFKVTTYCLCCLSCRDLEISHLQHKHVLQSRLWKKFRSLTACLGFLSWKRDWLLRGRRLQ